MDSITTATQGDTAASAKQAPNSETGANEALKKGNREVVTDYYVANDVNGGRFPYRVFIRLNAKKVRFTKVSFQLRRLLFQPMRIRFLRFHWVQIYRLEPSSVGFFRVQVRLLNLRT